MAWKGRGWQKCLQIQTETLITSKLIATLICGTFLGDHWQMTEKFSIQPWLLCFWQCRVIFLQQIGSSLRIWHCKYLLLPELGINWISWFESTHLIQNENAPALTHLLRYMFDSPFAPLVSFGDVPLCNDVPVPTFKFVHQMVKPWER